MTTEKVIMTYSVIITFHFNSSFINFISVPSWHRLSQSSQLFVDEWNFLTLDEKQRILSGTIINKFKRITPIYFSFPHY